MKSKKLFTTLLFQYIFSTIAHIEIPKQIQLVTRPSFTADILRLKWSPGRAWTWYNQQQWIVGSNYVPAYASNQIEMFAKDTFDIDAIESELSLSVSLYGMNSMRIFLHDLLYKHDKEHFFYALDKLLETCSKYGIRPLIVFFDSCWRPDPRYGKQPDPLKGIHNSRWLQSPGYAALKNDSEWDRLKEYVLTVVSRYSHDDRVLAWDAWNEPENMNNNLFEESADKVKYVNSLLPKVFNWIRLANPSQPVTSGVWHSSFSTETVRIQLEQSDFITFHNYGNAEDFKAFALLLLEYQRPVICTEWLARSYGNTVETILPIAKKLNIGMYNWGFVSGKTQTYLPYDSWYNPYIGGRQPSVWFHDLMLPNHLPYRQEESFLFLSTRGLYF